MSPFSLCPQGRLAGPNEMDSWGPPEGSPAIEKAGVRIANLLSLFLGRDGRQPLPRAIVF